jgi:adenine-specific DNA methylase
MSHAQLSLLRSEHDRFPETSADPSSRFTSLDVAKLRGGYYTPVEVAQWMTRWAIRSPNERVLEPSCGDGAFLESAVSRLSTLARKARRASEGQLIAIEIVPEEARKAHARAERANSGRVSCAVATRDFFDWWLSSDDRVVDVAIGNPPFIRYQSFPEQSRGLAMHAMRFLGLEPNRLTNSWVPFVAAATSCLREGGRLAFIVPAELLQVSYASQLRSFLADRFDRIDMVACNDLIFANAEQEVVILLAEGAKASASETNVCRVALSAVDNLEELLKDSADAHIARAEWKDVRHDSEKWLKYFLTNREIGLMRRLKDDEAISQLGEHASVDVGVVTGKNDFFVVRRGDVERFHLEDFVRPIVGRSVQLQGATFSRADWRQLATREERVYLLDIGARPKSDLPLACQRYIRDAEEKRIDRGYKCSIRSPWYAVPSVWIPDGFLFRQIYDFPRAVLNRADATSTDTIHRVRCKGKPDLVLRHLYTSLTAASAEIEGRSYGGGVLELEPTEAERILMPAALHGALSLAECDGLIRAGKIECLLDENDRRILQEHLGLSRTDRLLLRGIWTKMRDRRKARRRRSNGGGRQEFSRANETNSPQRA